MCARIRINSSHDRLAHKLPRMPGPRKQTADLISPKQARNDFLEKTFRTGEQKNHLWDTTYAFSCMRAGIRINSSHDRLAHKLPCMPGPRKQTADLISPKQARNDFLEKTFFT